jgi:hypothetical protein
VIVVIALVAAIAVVRSHRDSTPIGRFEPVLGYEFSSEVKIADNTRLQYPDIALISGIVDAVHGTARTTARDPSGSHPTSGGIYARHTTYVSVADWRRANLPPNAAQLRLLDHKHWVGGGPSGPADSGSFSIDGLLDSSPFIAAYNIVDQLHARHMTLHDIGEKTVRGVETTGYRFTRDTVANYANGPGVTHIVFEFWIDHSGRVRRLHVNQRSPETDDNAPQTYDSVTEYFDFGRKPTIAAPDLNDVVDGRALAQAFQCQPIPIDPPKSTPECR